MDLFWQGVIMTLVVIYIGICFGKIAEKNGKNPLLYGILSIVSPVNLIILGIWAFKKQKKAEKKQ
ncbi:hypothetical protein ACFLQ8_03725 [Candidatus Auribacterota bacterium]